MSDLFYKVLEMSIYGSIAILVVLLFRLVFKKCPKRVLILFWIVVGVRLVLPFNFNSPTSALNVAKLFAPKDQAEETVVVDPETQLRTIITVKPSVQEPAESLVIEEGETIESGTVQVTPAPQTSKITFRDVLPIVWLSVAAAMLIFSAVRYSMFYSKARWSSRSFDGRYYMANNIDSPFVVGVFSPKIFFPINMDDDEREYVLNHEWTHIKNKDGLTKLLSYIVLCIHWFNPLVWLSFFMLCADIEMRVDEETTSNFNLEMVKEYCKSLVRHAADDNKGAFMQSTAFSGISFGGMETKIRIKNLLDSKITSIAVQIVSIAVTMIFAILISASSSDHQRWVKEESVVPETSSTMESPAETSAPANGRRWDPGFVSPYITMVEKNREEAAGYRYALIYIDDDLVPEMAVEKNADSDNPLLSLYTYKDGQVLTVFEDCDYSVDAMTQYFYVPFEDFLIYREILVEGDDVFLYAYTMNGRMNSEEPEMTGHFNNPDYSIDNKKVSDDDFSEAFRTRESEMIECFCGPDKTIDILKSQESSGGYKIPTDIFDDDYFETQTTGTAPEMTEISETSEPAATSSTEPSSTTKISRSFDNLENYSVYKFNNIDDTRFNLDLDCGSVNVTFSNGNRALISVNGNDYYEDVPSYQYAFMYLVRFNGYTYLYIQFFPDEGATIYTYIISDSKASFLGVTRNIYFYYELTNPRTFWCVETYGNDPLVDIIRNYCISESSGLLVPNDGMMVRFSQRTTLKSTRDMTGCVIRDGSVYSETVTINAGDIAIPIQTDDHSYFDVMNEEGVTIRIDFKEQYQRFYTEGNPRWIYNAIADMFEPA